MSSIRKPVAPHTTSKAEPIYGNDVNWMSKAACKGMDVNMFFSPDGVNIPSEVRTLCDACPVNTQCYVYAERYYIDDGTFGGLSPSQRRNKRKTHGRLSKKFNKLVS
jgi:WhiB family redox-sensing transcriptional regulator